MVRFSVKHLLSLKLITFGGSVPMQTLDTSPSMVRFSDLLSLRLITFNGLVLREVLQKILTLDSPPWVVDSPLR